MSFKETDIGKIPSNWDVRSLGNITRIQNGYAFKSKYFSDKGNPVIKIRNVNGSVVDTNDCQLYPYELCESLDKFKIYNNDVLIAMTGAGSVGRVSKFLTKDSKTYYLNQRVGKIIPDSSKLNNEFLYQIISSKKYEKILFDLASGSGQPNLSPDTIGLVKVPYPPLQEQKAIANILSSLDDKIETNSQINKRLEEMAQAIFRQWFVDFEFPDENGEPYKSGGGEMVESELGMIPVGWEVGTICDMGEVVGGSTPSKKKEEYYTNNGIPWITPKDLSNNKNIFVSKGAIDITKEGFRSTSVKEMPKGTILFSSRAPIGYIAIAKNDVTTNQGFKSIVPLENQGFSGPYIYCWLKENIESIKNRASGSTFKEISGGEMKKIPAIIPNKDILDKFKNIQVDIFRKIEISESEGATLENIRDTLLPKLMSGEIRVPLDQES